MAEWLMVAYHEKGCSGILSVVRFVSMYGIADRASTNAAPTHTPVRTLSKVGVRILTDPSNRPRLEPVTNISSWQRTIAQMGRG